jgi:DNA replication protein DnaC
MKKKQEEPVEYSPMSPEEKADALLRLEREVEAHKQRIAAGEAAPVTSGEERRADRLAMDNIVSLGDCIEKFMTGIDKVKEKSEAHRASIREKISSVELDRCIDHPEQTIPIDEEKTIEESWRKDAFSIVWGVCPKCREERQSSKLENIWLTRGVPNKVLHATFDNYDTEGDPEKQKALAKFKAQVKRGSGFIIAIGKWGTGKSHLATATMKAMDAGIFITEHDLIGELRQTYSDNTGQDKMVGKYRTCKVLVLDELSPEVKGVDVSPLLYRVLGYRHDHNLLTVITSNDTLPEVLKILGPKLEDRMRQNYTVVNFTWKSHRKPHELET